MRPSRLVVAGSAFAVALLGAMAFAGRWTPRAVQEGLTLTLVRNGDTANVAPYAVIEREPSTLCGAVILPDGGLAVCNADTDEAEFYGPDGGLEGRSGDWGDTAGLEPIELLAIHAARRRVNVVGRTPAGVAILMIADSRRLERYSAFGLPDPRPFVWWPLHASDGRVLIVARNLGATVGERRRRLSSEGELRDPTEVWQLSPDTTRLLGSFESRGDYVVRDDRQSIVLRPPLVPRTSIAYGSGHFVLLDGSGYHLEIRNSEWTRVGDASSPAPPPASAADVEVTWASFAEGKPKHHVDRLRELVGVPDYALVPDTVFAVSTGGFVVGRPSAGVRSKAWDLWSVSGSDPLFQLLSDAAMQLLDVRSETIAYRDRSGSRLALYRLQR